MRVLFVREVARDEATGDQVGEVDGTQGLGQAAPSASASVPVAPLESLWETEQ